MNGLYTWEVFEKNLRAKLGWVNNDLSFLAKIWRLYKCNYRLLRYPKNLRKFRGVSSNLVVHGLLYKEVHA